MSSKGADVCRESEHCVQEKWSQDTSTCRASTSRGLSHSSGDCDGSETISYCSGKCSCASNNMYFQEYCEIPCLIADSTTQLRKPKWNLFKKYLNYRKKRKFKKARKVKIRTDHGKGNSNTGAE
ncbi:uncharacterized protein LOC113498732 [Trichoplusia ni]|uniref:Uncharacterized protein LOC113498732 n=1 Tax=Trichoplusia ni TaxID=7111 RepID=A0A7E5W2Y9_TRINI|nr:uncharacterized protein LOC113498732 [Trichoplusia ni]